jgi:hypothetical protein
MVHPISLQRLWLSADRARYFLTPADLDLDAGADTIRSIRGEVRQVDLDTLLPFEISEVQAQAWAREELGQVLQLLRQAFVGSEPASATTTSSVGNNPGKTTSSATPGLDLLAELSQTPRQSLEEGQGAIGRALGAYFKDIGATVADAISGDPARAGRAQERMACWTAVLGEAAEMDGKPRDAMPEKTGSPEAACEPVEAEELKAWAEPLRRLAEQMRLRADAIAAARQDNDSR